MHQNAFIDRINNMDKNIDKLFSELEVFEPDVALYSKILENIKNKQRSFARRRFFVFLLLFLTSSIALIPTFNMLYVDFVRSGFFQFFSLIFSDSRLIVSYWHNFIIILMESLPVVSLILFFVIVFIMLESLRFLTRDAKFIFSHNN